MLFFSCMSMKEHVIQVLSRVGFAHTEVLSLKEGHKVFVLFHERKGLKISPKNV